MVLSNRLDNTPRSLLQRTVLYVLGFGTGALLLAVGLGFAFVSLAEGVLPSSKSAAAAPDVSAGQSVRIIGAPPNTLPRKGASQKRPARGNEASDASDGEAEGPL